MCFVRRAAKMSSTSNDTLSNLINRHSVDGVEFDLLHRTSWVDAYTAYRCIKKEKASGNQASLWVRSQLQSHLYDIGSGIQRNAGKTLFVGLLVLAAFCIGLKSVHIENDLEKLWVEEGGRVTRELEYIRAKLDASPATFSDQIVIHTPVSGTSQNILRAENLLSHARMLELALQTEVELYDYAWSLEDICVKPSVPPTGLYYVDDILEKLMPCIIMTPLDCFWEGSKLLNRRNVPYVVVGNDTQYLRWSYLNPVQQLIDAQSQFNDTEFSFDLMQKYVSRAGMGTGYMERPCLNPNDSGCPKSAPNAKSKAPPSPSQIGAALTGGCYGIASNFMHWHEDLIMGGIQKNRSGVIVKAEALRSIVRIMEDKEVYAHHADSHSQVNSDWTVERAREVINAWQKKFTEQLTKKAHEEEKKQQFNVFTFSALKDIVSSFSRPSTTRLVIGAAIIVVYVCSVLVNVQKPELSQAFVGFIGVVLVALSLTSGFGLCALIGLTFNVTSTQVLPFLALGLGINGVFLLTHTLNKIVSSGSVPLEEQTGECLKRTGVNIVVSNSSLILALFAASLIPIPALRIFSLQAAILLTFSSATVLFLFPAVFSLDLQRRASHRLDLLCCLKASEPADETRNRRSDSATELVTGQPVRVRDEAFVKPTVSVISIEENDENELRLRRQRGIDDGCFGFSLSSFAADVYAPFVHHPAVRTLAVFSFVGLSVFGMWGVTHLEDGMQLSDLIPRQSHEFEYLIKQEKYFRFYSIFGVTQANFEYPANQRLLHEYHAAFARVGNIVKNDDGGLPDFWLSLFRDWLLGLQRTFDDELRQGFVNTESWTANATTDAILAYKLLVQTGRSDNPINKSQILTNRLVDRDGIIDNKAFYNYLTAWYNNDPLAYQASQAQLVPQPPHWDMIARSKELRIKKSSAIQYSQLPFYLHNVNSTKEITSIIAQLREISGKFEDRGLPNFPTGLPIVYWEQYLNLRFYMMLAIALILVTVFIMISLVLLNLAVASTIVVVLASCVCQVLGVLHALHTPLSAVPAVLVIMSVGMGVDFTLHLTMGYLTALGSKTRRVSMALEYMYAPMVHSVVTTLLGIAMLAFSEFEFVIRHFSYLLSAIVVIYSYSGFVVLPVLLNLVGPQGELIPRKNLNRIDPPTPRSSPALNSRKSSRRRSSAEEASASSSKRNSRRAALAARSDFSLSTITEEPSSYQCSSPEPEPAKIVVEPEITVETTTTTTNVCNGAVTASATTSAPSPMPSTASSGIDSRTDSPTIVTTTDVTPNGTNVTTKVTTTAKVKVEVHAPMPYMHHDCWAGRPPSRRGSRHTPDYRNSSSHFADFNKCR